MTYEVIEEWIGDFLLETGALPATDWVRYPQEQRRWGITWAELQALKLLPLEKIPNLIASDSAVVVTAGTILVDALPDKLFEPIDIWAPIGTPAVNYHWTKITADKTRFMHNLNMANGLYWYWKNTSVLGAAVLLDPSLEITIGQGQQRQIVLLTGGGLVVPATVNMLYKSYPTSYAESGGFDDGETPPSYFSCPFEGEEHTLALGAAAWCLLQDNDPRWKDLLQTFAGLLGVQTDVILGSVKEVRK